MSAACERERERERSFRFALHPASAFENSIHTHTQEWHRDDTRTTKLITRGYAAVMHTHTRLEIPCELVTCRRVSRCWVFARSTYIIIYIETILLLLYIFHLWQRNCPPPIYTFKARIYNITWRFAKLIVFHTQICTRTYHEATHPYICVLIGYILESKRARFIYRLIYLRRKKKKTHFFYIKFFVHIRVNWFNQIGRR